MLIAIGLANAEASVRQAHFADLNHWESIVFTDIDEPSSYTITQTDGGESFLMAESDGGGSGIVWEETIDMSKQPVIRWRWRVEQAPIGMDHRKKSGDDYPLRIQVIFEYDPARLGFFDKIEYETYRAVHGRYPPHAALSYVWTPNEKKGETYPCPYTDRVQIKVLRGEETTLGQWQEESVNIVEDYKTIFDESPPATARIAIMADSDDSQSRTRALVDFIQVREQAE